MPAFGMVGADPAARPADRFVRDVDRDRAPDPVERAPSLGGHGRCAGTVATRPQARIASQATEARQRARRRRTAVSPANCTTQTRAIRIAITTAITVVSKRW
jgi:hypothetical protein